MQMTVGAINLSALRTSRRLTQRELAKIIGVSQVSVARWESGTNDISSANAKLLADYFNVPVSQFLTPSTEGTNFKSIVDLQQIYESDTFKASEKKFGEVFSNWANDDLIFLKQHGLSMQSNVGRSIPDGSYVAISKSVSNITSLVGKVIYIKYDNGEYMLRELIKEGGMFYLRPWNAQFPIVQISDTTLIIGVVTSYTCLIE